MTILDQLKGYRRNTELAVPVPDNREQVARVAAIIPEPRMTKPQRGLIYRLLDELAPINEGVEQVARAWFDRPETQDAMTLAVASRTIDALKRHIAETPVPAHMAEAPAKKKYDPYNDIPNGRYAFVNDADVVKFFRVTRVERGMGAEARTFIRVAAMGSDTPYPIRDWMVRKAVLDKIRELGPLRCAQMYGRHLGHCGRCGRELTDETSRGIGIGPDCRTKEGWTG
jgi:uncharacterized protein DUF6011